MAADCGVIEARAGQDDRRPERPGGDDHRPRPDDEPSCPCLATELVEDRFATCRARPGRVALDTNRAPAFEDDPSHRDARHDPGAVAGGVREMDPDPGLL